jgi:hypothetical protein
MKVIFNTPEAVGSFTKIAAFSWMELIEFDQPAQAKAIGLLHDLITLETTNRIGPVTVDIPDDLAGKAREVVTAVWELTDAQASRYGLLRIEADQLQIGE